MPIPVPPDLVPCMTKNPRRASESMPLSNRLHYTIKGCTNCSRHLEYVVDDFKGGNMDMKGRPVIYNGRNLRKARLNARLNANIRIQKELAIRTASPLALLVTWSEVGGP